MIFRRARLLDVLVLAFALGAISFVTPLASRAAEDEKSGKVGDYDQWKQATVGDATDPATIEIPAGFKIERLRSATKDEDSWVSMAIDPQGRLTIGRESKGLLRMTLPKKDKEQIRVEVIDDTLLECRGLLYAFGSLYANANNSKGFYRLRDTDGDDKFDEVKLLRATPGNVGHGRNDLVLGPDERIYLIHGNDTLLPTDFETGISPYRNYDEDRLLPCEWNRTLFNWGTVPPAGHVIRTDRDGKTWELVAGGFRNPFGIDFNRDGEMFTYDADMEWDLGAPWYRPTRVNHIVSGGDYGWRQGVRKWAAYFPDSLPSNLDIGLGSPTAVKFGTRSSFPPVYQRALFILDWSYGRILAVHMQPQGASYACKSETFIKGRPLNVTDVDFGPDGAMYFITGGRRTQSGLYRVTYVGVGAQAETPTKEQVDLEHQAAATRALRRQLEALHGEPNSKTLDIAWPHLASDDVWIRHAARVAVERQDVSTWSQRALAETRPTADVTAMLALARLGDKHLQGELLKRLIGLASKELTDEQEIIALRACEISLLRQGQPDAVLVQQLVATFGPWYPGPNSAINERLSELLVYLEAPDVVPQTLAWMAAAKSQEEKLQGLFVLRQVKHGWTPQRRRTYIRWLAEADEFQGGNYMPRFIANIKTDALASLSDAERREFEPLLAPKPQPEPLDTALAARPLVRKWRIDDLVGSLEAVGKGRNFEQAKSMFAVALCGRCHRFGAGQGATVGPDLTAVISRFGRKDLLESIISPSKVIDDKYRNVVIETHEGKVVVGVLVGGGADMIQIGTNPLDPKQIVEIPQSSIESQQQSLVSPMPQGLLDTLSKDEVLDLIAYLEAMGNPEHRNFQK